jgi:predicted dienelactone hydrolase
MIRRKILIVIAACAAVVCASAPSAEAQSSRQQPRSGTLSRKPYYGNEEGKVSVGAIPDVALHDNDRNKDVMLTIEYPIDGTAPFPLLVWTPGFGGTNRSYQGYSSYWASMGYVVIRVSHGDKGSMDAQTASDWRSRVRDVTFVLDSLDTLEQRFPELKGKIDRNKIAVGGHSYGAFTAMLLGGLHTFPGDASYADPRVKEVVAISPPGPTERLGITKDSYTTLNVPALFITGSEDNGVTETETPDWRRDAFRLAPAGEKYLIVIEGARHASFTGRMDDLIEAVAREQETRDPLGRDNTVPTYDGRRMGRAEAATMRQQEIFGIARGNALAFFDATLKGDAKGREALEKANERKGVTLEKK